MQGVQWGFYQCEPDIWIVIAVDTQISSIEQEGSVFYYKHSPNGDGLVQAIEVGTKYTLNDISICTALFLNITLSFSLVPNSHGVAFQISHVQRVTL